MERLDFFFLAGYENRHMDPDPDYSGEAIMICQAGPYSLEASLGDKGLSFGGQQIRASQNLWIAGTVCVPYRTRYLDMSYVINESGLYLGYTKVIFRIYQVHTTYGYVPLMQFILQTRHELFEILDQPPCVTRKELVLQPPLGLQNSFRCFEHGSPY